MTKVATTNRLASSALVDERLFEQYPRGIAILPPSYGHGVRRERAYRLGMLRFRRMPWPMSLDNGTCLRRALTSISGRLITFIPAA